MEIVIMAVRLVGCALGFYLRLRAAGQPAMSGAVNDHDDLFGLRVLPCAGGEGFVGEATRSGQLQGFRMNGLCRSTARPDCQHSDEQACEGHGMLPGFAVICCH